ncbi:1-(5-phosphoribosyl)-5-[(5-phosphoribosylamino)methylideneamino]imidazole-4-carboxamide isomerase [Enterobacteriaceae endosymbiont of Neohaemonia nigricornis]|uniref:1-(5-phosphoribosyl)-5-[(5- phosphoribosylamino)methylideneamino]imidazole-4- carboxamide isomerase n=1 Tax=Enterobacteriaceae endosymbiont of Neohaemonia nigricornis TaxID=2675792 RepID=UPI001448F5D3|nr:1-(5-phosphoribosyl)-5-[(5-phosphoribosylamino)methylideneamino]imidazole-4-carboxamide isomerase [Enterobacteriaceae endosymbiont of Neohaemonia nigricornis]QJC30323.1 1-(5-phosphoribosyl)-5-[(5-phosphoribosylamino)methylideneamino]imidazole-4-carboxamide isomerase [Enterobacteriaceae endosymbiont of Neohaemonia nigricornis]
MIIPAIDFIRGQVVRLYQGQYNLKKIYINDPIFYIKKYISHGAQKLHIIDLDGAKNSNHKQFKLFKKILFNISIPIQIGGGIRTIKDINIIHNIIPKSKIIIGSSIINDIESVQNWINLYNKKIILAIDIKVDKNNNKFVYINGWQKNSRLVFEDIIEKAIKIGIKYILCTDITKDGTFQGPNFKLYKEIINKYPEIYFQSSGGVTSLNDIKKLKDLGIKDIIIGKAFLENKFTIQEANKCWQNA